MPLAKCVQGTPHRWWGDPPQRRLFRPRMSIFGGTLHHSLLITPGGTHATRGNGHTIHTPWTKGGGLWDGRTHDLLAIRRAECGKDRLKIIMCPR